MNVEARLRELGIRIPPASAPIANYTPVRRVDNLLFLAGMGPVADGKVLYPGKLGVDLSIEQGREAARLAALNQLSLLQAYLGDLDRVSAIVKLLGFVASSPEFYDQPKVIDGASDLFVEVFGDAGRHARSAIAAPCLPMNIPVEIELIVQITR
ncbi:MAG TPA: RidA family protein [Clostridia bacterium]|nr:RidA family protein [Clostridia bacterium]